MSKLAKTFAHDHLADSAHKQNLHAHRKPTHRIMGPGDVTPEHGLLTKSLLQALLRLSLSVAKVWNPSTGDYRYLGMGTCDKPRRLTRTC